MKNNIVLVCMGLVVTLIMFLYSFSATKRISDFSKYTLRQNSERIAKLISTIYIAHPEDFTPEKVRENIFQLMPSSFFGYDMICVVCDENQNVISSTLDFTGITSLHDILASIGIHEKWIDAYYKHIRDNDSSVFRFNGKKGFSNACIRRIDSTGWSVVQIVPSPIIHDVLYRSIYEQVVAVGIIVIMFASYMFFWRRKWHLRDRAYEKREVEIAAESLHDSLTGVLNRRAYDSAVDLLESGVDLKNVCVIVFDVNGLKTVNDEIGHFAGDEIIKGAADCIHNVFVKVGSCYRSGGDEFVVIIQRPDVAVDFLVSEFLELVGNWSGDLVPSLSVSLGVASAADYPTASINQLLSIADKIMYDDKRMYYAMRK